MSENRRLCQVKDELIQIAVQVAQESRIPRWRYEIDDLRCPRGRGHCDPSKPCEAWRSAEIRQRVDKIENELFVLGWMRADETFERSKP